ncbi:MAG: hypothetical protein ACOX6V_03865 [Patescibacteria group bacterium]|jgi:hypothetical protein
MANIKNTLLLQTKASKALHLLLIGLGVCALFLVHERVIKAETVTTNVTVGNTAPTFTAGPAENPVSSATTPTNVGSDVTFEATANDANGENYYLAICKTDAVTAVNGGAPTCDGGAWCVSSATASDAEATCSYTALQGDVESNDWYAFVCDGSAAAACSTSSQGSGDSGSPFKVNHAPIFNTIIVTMLPKTPDLLLPGAPTYPQTTLIPILLQIQ